MYKLKTTWTETLLAIAMVCSVWTQFRFASVIGISEILLLFIGFIGKYSTGEDLLEYHTTQDDYVKKIAIVTPFGLAWHFFVAAKYTDMLHDLFAFVFVAFMVYRIFDRAKIYEHLLGIISRLLLFESLMNIVYIAMYYSGIGFYMEERFTGLSTDPNQLAEVLFMIPWIGLYFLKKMLSEKPRFYTLHCLVCLFAVASSLYIGFLTESDTFVVTLILSVFSYFVFGIIFLFNGKSKSFFPLLVVIIMVFMVIINYEAVASMINEYLSKTANDANQLSTRQAVWVHGLEAFLASPIVGNGPGVYSGRWGAFGGAESHNTYIYILMDYGLIGFVVLVKMLFACLKKVWKSYSPAMMAGFVSFLAFNFFHSFHRMPLFWFFIYLFIAVGIYEQKKSEKPQESSTVLKNENVVYS